MIENLQGTVKSRARQVLFAVDQSSLQMALIEIGSTLGNEIII